MDFKSKLKDLENAGLLRTIRDRGSPVTRVITLGDREYINFSSNDYLGLAANQEIVKAASEVMKELGFGAGASRLLSGGTMLHQKLEESIAAFKTTESAVLLNSGYTANTGVIPALTNKETAIFSDELNHASIIDGCRLSRAEVFIYRHTDMEHLRELLKTRKRAFNLIVTDTVFSMDGDIAPLDELVKIAKEEGALLYIDDAHGTGVLGQGYGALRHFNLKPEDFIIQMGTLSKALGAFGAFVAATKEITDWIINSARSLIYSTALPIPVVAASYKAMEIIKNSPSLVQRLWKRRSLAIRLFQELNLDTGRSQTPIIPVLLSSNQKALDLSGFLLERGIYAPAIRRPTVTTPRIRITITASHTEEDIQRLADTLKEARQCGLL
ncbi:MAG: 8-amino-7-oxononanoate synthase [Nitrospirae bacterium]|nr:8-amino-7-oxononanoate synthase [Nitrospirota bacterium]